MNIRRFLDTAPLRAQTNGKQNTRIITRHSDEGQNPFIDAESVVEAFEMTETGFIHKQKRAITIG